MGLKPKTREIMLIWLAIVTAIVVAIYRLVVTFANSEMRSATVFAFLPAEDWITNLLIFWALILLLFSCFMWRTAAAHQRELEVVISSVSPDVLLVVTPDRTVNLCNPAVKGMFGYEPGDVIGRKTDLLYFDRRLTQGTREIHDSLDKFGFHVGFATGRRKTGETFPLEIITGDMLGRRGAVVLIRDITDRKRGEEQLQRAKESVELANAEKGRALAELAGSYSRLKALESLRDNLTHMVVRDIRHAVSEIGSSLDTVKRAKGPGASPLLMERLEQAIESTDDVLRMIQTLLDIGKMEAGQMPLVPALSELGSIVKEAEGPLGPLINEKNLRLSVPDAGVAVFCDRNVIVRVMQNLLANAVKYAPAGTAIVIRAATRKPWVTVSVTDEGPGVPAEFQGTVFEKFGRVDMKAPGSDCSGGLGLTFCKLAVEAHGGRIGVESPSALVRTDGPGSTFWFTLPADSSGRST